MSLLRNLSPAVLVLALLLVLATGCGTEADDGAGSEPVTPDSGDRLDQPADNSATDSSVAADDPAAADNSAGTDDGGDVGADGSNASDGAAPVEPDDRSRDEQPATAEPVENPTAVVLRTGGIDDDFAAVIGGLDGIEWLSLIEVGQVHLIESRDRSGAVVDDPPDGFAIQLEARAYDSPEAVADIEPDLVPELHRVAQDEVILSRSSAAIRRLDVGGTITVDNGSQYRVAAVLDDELIGTSEVVFVGPDALDRAGGGGSSRRLAFVGYRGTGPELEAALLGQNDGDGVRVFGGRGNRDRDRRRTTLPAIRVKEIFGEFAFRPASGSSIEIDPAWVDANIVIAELPLLGPARCHRLYAEILTEVLQGLIDDGLGEVIDPGAFQGCWNPRRIAGSARLSKHAWGMAADINFGNPLDDSPGSPVHPELLERMLAVDVISGHLWTATPDPGHFEYRGP